MIYTIKAVKKTQLAKRDGSGTWTKVQIKTNETGDDILELGYGHSKILKDNIKAGDKVTGYIEKTEWFKSDGNSGGFNTKLQGITPEYLYKLILRISPDIETLAQISLQGPDRDTFETPPEDPNF